MWEVRDTVLPELLEPGDIVDWFGDIVHVTHIEDHPTSDSIIIIHGRDDEWGEPGTWEYPIDSLIELMTEE